ncbi:phosphatase PAP2 family protein [Bradyrhizobium sp. S69]|uniref:phosphatase PAP2 family protein n=1 Tax=Bradyrhizobium sp. S69 TaxID=1641856 RepID=UPI00131C3B5D|nr:phosphatase PAP2 family protein [Bradyrhizobium sp. S69]
MASVTVQPTNTDVSIANAIASHTGPRIEKIAKATTWGADEHILSALAIGWWIYARNKSAEQRRISNHVLLTTVVSSALPHLLKTVFDQERPDRLTVRGHWRGVPFSGKRLDAFPSGHAVHVGALVSVASVLPGKPRAVICGVGATLVLTRIILLAHWTSDVVAGLCVGALVERMLRPITGYGSRSRPPNNPMKSIDRKIDRSIGRRPTDERTRAAKSTA